ncbi:MULTISPECIES: LrgB family protein [Bacillus]|uniref:LrgB family protein n=1 Tax=Bacillus TaxID=1386 RepID=UPI001D0CFF34|nr:MULTISPECIES: LrgB family protein [Bacillus]
MTMLVSVSFILLTVIIFISMRFFYERFKYAFFVPVLTSSVIIILFLLLWNISYSEYREGTKWLHELLGPAVVALAFPLYHQRKMIMEYKGPLTFSITSGIVTGIVSAFLFAKIIPVDTKIAISSIPKSVTTPVAMDIAHIIGGSPSLAAAFVMIAGVGGAMLGPFLFKTLKIYHYIGIGVGLGAASHGIGTARALEFGKKEAAVSSISMTISAIIYSIILPFAILYFL